MANEWREASLGELTDWASGGTPPKENPEYWGGNIPWISASSMKSGRLSDSDRTLTMKGLEQRSKLARKNDILLLVRGSELHKRIPVGIATRDVAFNQDVKSLRPKNGLSSTYLYYWLAAHESMLLSKVEHTGIGAGKLDTAVLKNLRVQVPPIEAQRAIAHILSTLDDKIELNRRRNQTLEDMARALFKDWFVDFGPVRTKIEGQEPYLPEEIWRLFPERLDDEGKPVEWEMSTVGECFNLTMGQSPPGDTYNDIGDGLPFFQGRTDFGFRYPENRKYCSAPTRIANAEDTLVSVRAPVGDINLAWEKCCIGRGVASIRHLSCARSFTYHAMWVLQDELKQYEHTGTVFGAINKKQFEAMGFLEPSRVLIDAYEHRIGPLDDEIRNNIGESRTLAQLRDTLLPKLISGELRIPNFSERTANLLSGLS